MFNFTNFWKNHVIDNVLDELPSTDDYNIPDIIDKKTEDLLNQKAFDELSDPWPQPPEQDIEPVKTYEEYHKVYGQSISPERSVEAQVWNCIHGRADQSTSHGH